MRIPFGRVRGTSGPARAPRTAALLGMLAGALASYAAAAAPVISLSRTQIDFGRIPSQIASSVQPVFVTNTGDAPLTVRALTIGGQNASDFSASGTCTTPIVLAPGARCRIDLTLYAGFSTARPLATLDVDSDATLPAPTVRLSATLDNGSLYLGPPDPTPDWLDFSAQAVGTSSPPASLTLANVTGLTFTLGGITMAGADADDFAVSSPCRAGDTLARDATCAATVTFTPRADGPRAAELRFVLSAFGISGSFSYSVTGVGGTGGAAFPDLNQHGLTGSWYQPATSGQGIEVEVFADAVGAGTGYLQGSWFTFDHAAAGGADKQRWYTFGGSVASGQSSAAFPLLRNAGGNFNAPPVTSAVQIGTITLGFTDCRNGTMRYAFDDGHSGTIPLSRLTPNVTCTTSGARPTNADFGYSGNWYDSATSGQGLVVEVNPLTPIVFVAWYTYAPAGAAGDPPRQRWYTGQAPFTPGARTVPMNLYETVGGLFDNSTPAARTTQVGAATLTFVDCATARWKFEFAAGSSAGASGTIQLVRVGRTPAGCGP